MKLRALWVSILVVFSAMVIMINFTPTGEAVPVYVGSGLGNDTTSIQDAIDNYANNGDMVFVYSGLYNENVVVDKTITLQGEDRDLTIIDSGGGDAVQITANWANITGFTVTGAGWFQNNGGIELSNVNNCSVTNNYVTGNARDGIRVLNTVDSTIEDNVMEDNGDEGIHIQGSFRNYIINNIAFNHHGTGGGGGGSDGILVYQSSGNTVLGNDVSDNDNGINVVDGSDTNVITNNVATQNSQYGIVIDSSIDNNLTFNALTNNGIFIDGDQVNHWNTHSIDPSNTVNGKPISYLKNQIGGAVPLGAGEVILANCSNVNVNNQIIANSSVGIEIGFSSNNTILNNEISNQSYGIYHRESLYNNITDNNLLYNEWGIWDRGTTFSNISNNNISNNVIGIRIRACENNNYSFNEFYSNSENGVYITSASYQNWVGNNTIADSYTGIHITPRSSWRPSDNYIMGNIISDSQVAINLDNIPSNTLSSNIMSLCGIFVEGTQLSYWNTHEIDTTNTVNGKSVYYWKDQSTGSVPTDGGQVILANCTNVVVSTSVLTFGTVGVELGFSDSNDIAVNNASSNNWFGIYLYLSDNNVLLGNTASYNGQSGIHIGYSQGADLDSNTMYNDGIWIEGNQIGYWNSHFIETTNTVNANPVYYWKDQVTGIVPSDGGEVILANCSNVEILNSELNIGTVGIQMGYSFNITTNGNNLSGNRIGIYLYNSDQSIIINNTASYNTEYGIQLISSGSNLIYHNNIIENTNQASDNGGSSNWNEVYSVCGNYWSDYSGSDLFYGTLQDILGSDGVGDTPRSIDWNSADDYPLMNPWDFTSSIPTAPQNLVATPGNTYVNLTWSPPLDDGGQLVYTYRIYRNTTSGNEVFYLDSGADSFFNDTGVIVGVTYFYEISAVTIMGEGPISGEVFGMPYSEPSEPLGLMIGSGDSFANLSWTPPLEDGGFPVTNYTIYRGPTSGSLTFLDEIGNLTTYNDTTVTNGIPYYYIVRAKNSVGEGLQSNEVNATPVTIPGPPIGVITQVGDSYINITWTPPFSDGGSPILDYRVYRGTVSGDHVLLSVNGIITNINDTTVSNGIQYFYVITAMNIIGEGPTSLEVSATPARTPFNVLNPEALGTDTLVNISWQPPSDNGGSAVTGYRIYKGTESGILTFLEEIGNILYYEDTDVINGMTYYYQVSALNTFGEGPRLMEVSATPAAIPGAPSGLTTFSGDSYVELSWSVPVSDGGAAVTNYRIYRDTTPGSEKEFDEVGNVLTYNDTSVTNGETYYYKVVAVNEMGKGPFSNEESGTPLGPPSPPLDPQIEGGESYVYIIWDVPDSDGGSSIIKYMIFRGTSSGSETLYDNATGVLYYNDTSVTNGIEYFYKIKAVNAVGEGVLSNEVSATPFSYPSAPLNVTTASGDAYVYLTWDAPESIGSSSITNYVIFRGTESGGETLLSEIGDTLFYNDTSVSKGVTYYYYIVAKNSEGPGAESGEVSDTPVSPPGIVSNLISGSGDSFVQLTWNAPISNGGSDITGYRIYRGSESGGQTFLIEIGNLLTYNDTTVTNGVTYYYKISSVNTIGEGPQSGETSSLPQKDTDGDGKADHIDDDDDGDGLLDSEELDLGTDPFKADSDGDGHDDAVDEFPLNSGKWKEEEPESSNLMLILLLIIIVVVILVLFLATRKKGDKKEDVTGESEEKQLPPPPGSTHKEEEEPETEWEETEEKERSSEGESEEIEEDEGVEEPKEGAADEISSEESKVNEPDEQESQEDESTGEESKLEEPKEDIPQTPEPDEEDLPPPED
jgi:parallel beta-helix repeat protein